MTDVPGPHGRAAVTAVRRVLNDPVPVVEALAAEYGRTFAIHAGPLTVVVVGDRELVKTVLTGPQSRYKWGPMFRIPLGVFVGPTSMLVSDGDDHARRRSMVQPAFALRRLETWRSIVLGELDTMIDELPLDEPFDLAPRLQATIRRIVLRVLFGTEMAAAADDIGARLEPAAAYINRPVAKQPPHPFPWGARQRARRSRAAFDERLDQEIARRRADPDPTRDDILESLLAVDGLTDQELRDQVVSLIGAGYDTTTATASWLILEAARQPETWRRLRDEADAAGPDDPRPWASAVVHESLRIHPAGAFAPRLVAEAFELGPYQIAKRSVVAWSPLLVGRDPETWPDPLRFDPSRHVDRDEPEYAWLPFGAGSRSCLGFGLARMNLTLVASRLAARVDLERTTTGLPAPIGMVTSHPVGGVPVRVTARR